MTYADVLSKAVVLLLLICCLLLLPLWESVIVLCFIVYHFLSSLVFLLSWWGRESWLPANFVFLASRDCCVALPCDAMSLSAVCDSGIS